MSNSQPHPSLPARPPPSSAASSNQRSNVSNGRSGFTAFKPRSIATTPSSPWQDSGPQRGPAEQPQTSAGYTYPYQAPSGLPQQPYYPQQQPEAYQEQIPQIRNPFVAVSNANQDGNDRWNNSNYDPDYEAQVAQWQAAYAAKDDDSRGKTGNANYTALGTRPGAAPADANVSSKSSSVTASVKDEEKKTVVRSGGGRTWEDTSLLEWDPAHFRLFVGNLAGEVTDDSMLKAFSKYTSVQKARVVRDKRTTKSRGFGFVSFSDGDDYFKAAKEMQGKYIGSHPVILRKATSEVKPIVADERGRKNNNNKKNGNNMNGKKDAKGKGYEAGGHANTGAGITKKPAKTKDGLKILG